MGGAERALTPATAEQVSMVAVDRRRVGFTELYRRSYGPLVAQLVAVTGARAEAEDVVQEAFVRAAQRWEVVGRYDLPEAWVRRVAINLAISHQRRLRRHRSLLHRWGSQLSAGETDGPEASSGDHVVLLQALRTMPVSYRVVLSMHYLADMDVRRIAAELDIPEGTVKTRLARGRARLKDRLAEQAPGADPVVVDVREHVLSPATQPVDAPVRAGRDRGRHRRLGRVGGRS